MTIYWAQQETEALALVEIPIGEQAQYAATEFAPALARLQTAGR